MNKGKLEVSFSQVKSLILLHATDSPSSKRAFDPQAPVTRKGVLMNFKTGDPMLIPDQDLYGRCRQVTEFEKLNRVGEGTYGIVCKYTVSFTTDFFIYDTFRPSKRYENRGNCCVEKGSNGSRERWNPSQ